MNDVDRIIGLFLAGKASKSEVDQLQKWIKASTENRQIFEIFKKNWNERTEEPILINEEEVFERVWKEGTGARVSPKPFGFAYWGKIAATFLIVVIVSYLMFLFQNKSGEETVGVMKQPVMKENPAGQKSRIFMPDGTIIWLNAESTLRYLEEFTDSVRVVNLDGEAYFEVAEDSLRPFIVQSGDIYTEALGTTFNINYFPENEDIAVNLISGKVKVTSSESEQDIILNPGEALSFDRNQQNSVKYKIDISKAAVWKDGILTFENATFEQIVQKLERWYGVRVNVEGDMPQDWQFSGWFDNESLVNVLKVMQYTRGFQFKLKNKHVNIVFN